MLNIDKFKTNGCIIPDDNIFINYPILEDIFEDLQLDIPILKYIVCMYDYRSPYIFDYKDINVRSNAIMRDLNIKKDVKEKMNDSFLGKYIYKYYRYINCPIEFANLISKNKKINKLISQYDEELNIKETKSLREEINSTAEDIKSLYEFIKSLNNIGVVITEELDTINGIKNEILMPENLPQYLQNKK